MRNAGNNSDKITADFFDSLLVETRYMDAGIADTKMKLWGEVYETPITTAALSHLHNTAADGMVKYAEGAFQAGALHFVGMGSDEELEAIIKTGAKTVKIIKPHEDNDEVYRKIEHAVKAGCIAVGMDIDHAFSGNGGYDNVMGLPMKAKSTDEIADFIKYGDLIAGRKMPFVVKGVLSAHDAAKSIEAGASAIVVSHHHGMIDYAVPPLMVLPEILEVTEGKIPVFVDCGFETGMDCYKALALGATAVSVGRSLMPYLKDGGKAVGDRITEMNNELKAVMNRTGVKDLAHFDKSVIHERRFL